MMHSLIATYCCCWSDLRKERTRKLVKRCKRFLVKRFKILSLRWIQSPTTTTCYSHFRKTCMICTGNVTWGNVIGGCLSYITHRLLLLPFASGVSLRASAPHRADGNTNTSKSLFIPQINLYTLYICITSNWLLIHAHRSECFAMKMCSGSTPCQFLPTVSPFALMPTWTLCGQSLMLILTKHSHWSISKGRVFSVHLWDVVILGTLGL